MKKRNQISLVLILLMAFSSTAYSQDYYVKKNSKHGYAKMERSNELFFKEESTISEVQISVTEEFNFLSLKIECRLKSGELLVEILNPKGEIKGNFTVINNNVVTKGKNTQSKETVVGHIEKQFRTPSTGNWLVRIKPKNATGMAMILNTLVYNPRQSLLETYQIIPDTESNIK